MGAFVSLLDLANSLQMPVVNSVGNTLIELAEGKVIEQIGDHAPWTPSTAYATPRSVVLAAAGRPLRNPKGVTRKQVDAVIDDFPAERLGVYLTEEEKADLAAWQTVPGAGSNQSPVGSFPDPLCWPDPARGPRAFTTNPFTDYGQ